MSMEPLYKITEDYNNLFNELHELMENEEIDEDGAFKAMEELDGKFKDKLEIVMKAYKNELMYVEAINMEINKLKARIKSHKDKAAFYKRYMASNMLNAGYKKLEFSSGVLSGAKWSESIDDNYNVEKIPDIYLRRTVKIEPKKKELLQAIKNKEEIFGATIKYTPTVIIR